MSQVQEDIEQLQRKVTLICICLLKIKFNNNHANILFSWSADRTFSINSPAWLTIPGKKYLLITLLNGK